MKSSWPVRASLILHNGLFNGIHMMRLRGVKWKCKISFPLIYQAILHTEWIFQIAELLIGFFWTSAAFSI